MEVGHFFLVLPELVSVAEQPIMAARLTLVPSFVEDQPPRSYSRLAMLIVDAVKLPKPGRGKSEDAPPTQSPSGSRMHKPKKF
jgi:hypothetical protein